MKRLLEICFTLTFSVTGLIYGNTLQPISPFVTENTYVDSMYDENGARNAAFDNHALVPYTESQLRGLTRASNSNQRNTPTGGTLTSNAWMSRPTGTIGAFEYQVSAQYNRTDHTNIKTTWFAEAQANTGASLSIGLTSVGFGSNNQTRRTESRYWENTRSQQDASFRTNGFIQGNWNWISIENQAQVWGGSVGAKPTEVSTRTGY